MRTAALAALALLAAATAAQAACPQRLGVGHGDTLESIAQACGISVETLRGANPGLTAETLRPGRFIAVPRAALPSPQLPFGRRSVEPVPQLVPPATGASPSRTVIAPPPPAMQHPQMPEGFDTRPQHMRPHPRGPTFGPRFPLQRN